MATASGFVVMDTPGYDPTSMTGIVAGGANNEWGCMHCGRTRTDLAEARTPLLQEVTATGGRSLICRNCLGAL